MTSSASVYSNNSGKKTNSLSPGMHHKHKILARDLIFTVAKSKDLEDGPVGLGFSGIVNS